MGGSVSMVTAVDGPVASAASGDASPLAKGLRCPESCVSSNERHGRTGPPCSALRENG